MPTEAPPAAPAAPTPAAPAAPAAPAQSKMGVQAIPNMPQPGTTPSSEPAPTKTSPPMDDMFKRIDDRFAPKDTKPATTEPPKDKTEPKQDEPAKTDDTDAAADAPKTDDTKPADGKPAKVNPWKLVEEHKTRAGKAEAEIARLLKLVPNQEQREAEIQKVKELETQNKELLEHMRFVDYQKHPEFKEKYDQPYTESWNRIMRRLNGVSITEADGVTRRPIEPKDIAEISRLPADAAIELAEQKFGKLGPWVAERVEELRQLDEARYQALEKAKKEGNDFRSKWAEQQSIEQKKLTDLLSETWTKATAEIETHSRYGEFFRAKEGDDEFNAALESATAKVDKYWGKNPMDPDLTVEQRAEIVKGHAAVRNRARAFGVQNLTIKRLRDENARLAKENEQFKSSVPRTDGSQPAAANGNQSSNPWDRFNTEAFMRK